jgi:hypothetical protein
MTRPNVARTLLGAVVLFGVAARVVAIDRLPGINGDEAWYGVNVHEILRGGTPFLQTPSGNVVNPVHSFPLLLISMVARPSFAVLRAPEVWWGVLTMMLAYPLLAAPLGRRAAWLTTLLVALSPTAIVYARLGWDPSGTPFVSLLTMALALRDRPVAAAIGVAVAYLVHPTNIFLAPFAAACWAPHGRRRYLAASEPVRKRLRAAAAIGVSIAIPVGAVLILAVARMGRLPSLEMVVERVVRPSVWRDVWMAFLRLVSGVTATAYAAGPLPTGLAALADVAAFAVMGVATGALLWRATNGDWRSRWLAAGCACSLLMFHVIGGPIALEPGHERYAMSLLIPLTIWAAIGLDAVGIRAFRTMVTLTAAIAVAYLSLAIAGYFHPLVTRGGDAHPTFRTGHVEPKAAAYRHVRREMKPGQIVAVFAEDWWIYWPVRYLAIPDRQSLFVEMLGDTPPVYPAGAARPAYPRPPDQVFAIVFAGGAAWSQVRDSGTVVFTAVDPQERPILYVVALDRHARLPFADPPPWQPSERARQ